MLYNYQNPKCQVLPTDSVDVLRLEALNDAVEALLNRHVCEGGEGRVNGVGTGRHVVK